MYIPHKVTQNYPFYRLKLMVETFGHSTKKPTNQNLLKVPKVDKPTNKKTLLCNFGDECNKQPIVPSLSFILIYFQQIIQKIWNI